MNEDLLRELAELREEVKGLNAKLDNISERVLNAAHNEVFENDRISLQKGLNEVEQALKDHPFVFVYLGHYCNWEWVSSLPLWQKEESTHCAQLYRPLKNKWSDDLFKNMRSRFGSENISKYDALRRILAMKKEGTKGVIGFISDQTPSRNNIHHWVNFLHQDTPVVSGTERIARKVNAAVFFADVQRIKRGYYRLVYRPITLDVAAMPEYALMCPTCIPAPLGYGNSTNA